MDQQQQKQAAAARAADLIEADMRVGLGTGSTADAFVEALAARVRDGLTVTCAATSERTQTQAGRLGVAVRPLEDFARLDVAVDGADEIDPQLRLIKGGGGAHLREKMVADVADRFVIIADSTKCVATLGAFPLPVEVVRFAWPSTARRIALVAARYADSGEAVLRMAGEEPFVTDEGHYILDLQAGRIRDPESLERALDEITGVVEHGLFIGYADEALIGAETRLVRPGGSDRARRG